MSKLKRVRQRNAHAAFILGITVSEYISRLLKGELPQKLKPRTLMALLSQGASPDE